MNCLFHDCTNSPAGDYPACSAHSETMHFTNRFCHCRHCEAERIAEPALRLMGQNDGQTVRWSNETYAETAKAAGGVLAIRTEAA